MVVLFANADEFEIDKAVAVSAQELDERSNAAEIATVSRGTVVFIIV